MILFLVILLFGWEAHDLRQDMADYSAMEVWTCEDVQDVYYLRLDYFDLLTQIEEDTYISPTMAVDLVWCSIYEMNLFERLNQEQ